VRSYLTITKDLVRVMDAGEGHLSQLGHSLYRQAGLCAAPSCRVAREDQRTGSAPAGRVLLPTLDALRTVRQEVRRELLAEGKNTRPGNDSARFLRLVRSGQPYCLGILQTRTVSAPRGSCGPTADLASRHKAAPITVVSTGSCIE